MSEFPESPPEPPRADDWTRSLSDYLEARIELIRIESRTAGKEAAKRAGLAAFSALCAIAAWLLTLAGLIGLIAASQEWPWYTIALAAAGLHLLLAGVAILFLKRTMPPAFPLTRSELSKDREWISRLHSPPKSPN